MKKKTNFSGYFNVCLFPDMSYDKTISVQFISLTKCHAINFHSTLGKGAFQFIEMNSLYKKERQRAICY